MTADAYTVAQLAQALGIDQRAVQTRAKRQRWQYSQRTVRGGHQRLYAFANLPTQVQAAVALAFPVSSPPASSLAGGSSTAARPPAAVASSAAIDGFAVDPSTGEILGTAAACDSASLWAAYERAPEGMKVEAKRKHDAVLAVAKLVDSGTPVTTAIGVVSSLRSDVPEGTLSGWWYKILRHGRPEAQRIPRPDWLAALCDRYVGRTATAECSPEAWDWYKGQYLTRKGPSHADTYRRLQAIAKAKGWTIPSGATLRRRLNAEVSPMVQVLEREGPEALARMLPPQERDRSVFAAGEAANGDGLKFDRLWIKFADGEVLNTTTVWFWQDIGVGKITAWRAGKTENTDMFRLATYDLTAICAPRLVWIDNTRVAANKLMTAGAENRHRFRADPEDGLGLLLQLGMQPRFTNPDKEIGNPGAKPIERAFGIGGLHEMVATHPRFIDRGYSAATAILFEEFVEVLAEEVARFNAQEGRRTRVCRGVLSYDQAWDESVAKAPLRRLTESQRRLLLLAREVATVDRRTGVVKIKAGKSRLGTNSYWSETLARFAGDRVCVMYDPDRLSADAAIYTLDGRYLCEAQHRPTAAFDSVEAGREAAKFKRRLVNATKQAADAQTRMTALERAAVYGSATGAAAPAKPAAKQTGKVVKGHFKRTPDPARDRRDPPLPKAANGDTVEDRFAERMGPIAEAFFNKTRI